MPPAPLPVERLYLPCPDSALPFETTDEIADGEEPVGQDRAAEALALGLSVRGPGYNVYALGPPGIGLREVVLRVLAGAAARAPRPDDWCYVHDFAAPQRPRALRLPAGRAVPFQREMSRLVEDLRVSIPAVFESEDYRTRLLVMEKQLEEARDQAMAAVQAHARERKVAIVRTPVGLAVAPVAGGEVVEPDKFRQLPAAEQERIQADIAAVQGELQAALRGMPQLEREHRERVKTLNREVALYAVQHLVDDLRGRHADLPDVLRHLDAALADIVENVRDFLGAAEAEDAAGQVRKMLTETPALHRYAVNVLVDNGGGGGAPVVEEEQPSFGNLLGRIEHHAHFGTLVTDFTLVRAGALHRANGGYLVLDARRLLGQPLSWEHLKRALEARRIRIESPERALGLGATASLEPEPIPLDAKVVLVGDRLLYHLLSAYDPEYLQHFKVAADFADDFPRAGNELACARQLAAQARGLGLRPLQRAAVARVIEQAARLCGDAERLSASRQDLADLLREADHQAAAAGRATVARADVEAALQAQERRHARVRERTVDEIARGTLLIATAGSQVGQVNGLSVLQMGPFGFGRPTRITARVRLGRGEVVDIEREVELGGPLHSKGVLILAGFLGARYAAAGPFPLSASLVFEQSYGGVEGDSASSAELYALLSALSGVPLRQSIAVTGSVNQLGEVQAIGGVNEKIEGFFDVCARRGLSGGQGVLIPASNAHHLMLRGDVVRACSEGRFRIWAVEHVDEGIEVLTGIPAGAAGADGGFPAGTVNALVAARLARLAEEARAFSAADGGARQP